MSAEEREREYSRNDIVYDKGFYNEDAKNIALVERAIPAERKRERDLLVSNTAFDKRVDKEMSTDRARVQKSARSNEAHPVNTEKVSNGATKDAKRARGDGHFGASSANLKTVSEGGLKDSRKSLGDGHFGASSANLKTVSEGGLKDSRKSPGVGPFGAPFVNPKKVNKGGLKETHKTPYRNSY